MTVVSVRPDGRPVPGWAVLQRKLLHELDGAWREFADRCTEGDGRVRFQNPDYLSSRDAVDDFYEIFFNWPTLGLVSGSTAVIDAAKRHWSGITQMMTELGRVTDEYEVGYDWFHQGEGNLLFYGICMAAPDDPAFIDRAARFADLYLGGPPGNYDPDLNMMRAIHNGAGGPRYGLTDHVVHRYPWTRSMDRYGLPFTWLGVDSYEDLLADEAAQLRMGAEMERRMGRGDSVVSLGATSLALNALLVTGDDRYRDWLLRYTDGWVDRAARNGGVVPDNVGPTGAVGELMDGRWYGGHYGWSFPHGIESVGSAVLVAAVNAHLLDPHAGYLQFVRQQLDFVLDAAVMATPDRIHPMMRAEMARRHGLDPAEPTLLVPARYSDEGHFDLQPPPLDLMTALWTVSQDAHDLERIRYVRAQSSSDPQAFLPFRNKGEDGHTAPWLSFLDGVNPAWPEVSLSVTLAILARRLELIRTDTTHPGAMTEWHYQALNPVLTEVLLQQVYGGPQVVYNGGLLQAQLSYTREDGRTGLPDDVSALVTRIAEDRVDVTLVNTSFSAVRELRITGGALGEHRVTAVAWTGGDAWPGPLADQFAPAASDIEAAEAVHDGAVRVILGPGARVDLRLDIRRFAHPPGYGASRVATAGVDGVPS